LLKEKSISELIKEGKRPVDEEQLFKPNSDILEQVLGRDKLQ